MLQWENFADNCVESLNFPQKIILSRRLTKHHNVSTEISYWGKNGTNQGPFSDQISVRFAHQAKMYQNLILKSPGFVQFGANLSTFGPNLTSFFSKSMQN